MARWCSRAAAAAVPVLVVLIHAAQADPDPSAPSAPGNPFAGLSPPSIRASQLGFLESTILGVLPSAVLTRYLSKLRLGGSLNDPQTLMTTEELIRREGYPVETYTVTTEDGYMPVLVRIPHGGPRAARAATARRRKTSNVRAGSKARPQQQTRSGKAQSTQSTQSTRRKRQDKSLGPVLITHGVLQCSDNWVLRGKDHDLPFMLADAGYDVWLANTRGSTYSRSHQTYPDTDHRFWDYTLHEPGVYDLPAFIEKVLETTNSSKLHYIGHSMGTTIFYILGSSRPDLMEKVRLAVHFAPVTYWSRIQSSLAKRAFQAAAVLKRLNMPMLFDNYSSRSNRSVFLADALCRDGSPVQSLCMEALFGIVGSDKAQLNMSMLPMIFAHFPAGASVGQVAHFYQNYEQGAFHQFDYGADQNILKYGNVKPPDYDLSKVTAPVAIWYGLNDRLVYHEDVEALSKQLPNLVGLHLVPFPKFNHFDFLWAKDSHSLLYDHVLEVMSQF